MRIGQAIWLSPMFIYKGFLLAETSRILITILAPLLMLAGFAVGHVRPSSGDWPSIWTYLPSWFFEASLGLVLLVLGIGIGRLWGLGKRHWAISSSAE